MHPYIIPLHKALEQHADAEKAAGAKAYMKNQFDFLGIQMLLRRRLCKEHMKQNKNSITAVEDLETIVKELWELPKESINTLLLS